MNYTEAENYIHSLEVFGSKLGLERMNELLKRLDSPEKSLKFVHIAGTNGKGSVTTMVSDILTLSGYKTGKYTSPFVSDFRERFQIDSKMIPKRTFSRLVKKVKMIVDKMSLEGNQLTEFEVNTAIAMLYFKEQNCDIVCLEVGLGGRFDATNVIDTPLVSVITAIALDHTHILGDTIEKIAFEKAGIIKKGCTCVSYPLQKDEAAAEIMQKCAETGSKYITANSNAVKIISSDITGSDFLYSNEHYHVGFVGKHQVYNAVTAILTTQQLTKKGFSIPEACVKEGLQGVSMPARFEIVSKSPLIILDGAHNPQGMKALSETVKDIKAKRKLMIIGMLADKDYDTSLSAICPFVDEIITVDVNNPRALDAKALMLASLKYCENVSFENNLKKAYTKALKALDKEDMLLICGSLYMVSDMRRFFKK